MLTQYRYTKKDYQDIIIKEYESFNGYLDDAKNIMDPQNQLITQFHIFIEEVIKIRKAMKGCDKEPMVFVFIDDADLSCERCEEVLNVIIRYLSQPNIITFVAGDINKFKEVLLVNYLNHMNIINVLTPSGFSDGERAKELLSGYDDLVEDNVKKILPPSLRYHLKEYSYDKRLKFTYDNNKSLHELIELCFGIDVGSWKLSNAYGIIFDSYPRGLMNVYYELFFMYKTNMESLENGENDEKLLKRQGEFLEKLLHVIIRSSTTLTKAGERKILQCIHIENEKGYFNSWIDFIKANEINFGSDRIKICVFTLLNFMENIINIFAKKQGRERRIHGANIIYRCLSGSIKESVFRLLPNLDDLNMELELYHQLVNNAAFRSLQNITNTKVRHDSYLQYFKILNSISDSTGNTIGIKKIIEIASTKDIIWSNKMFQIINLNRNVLRLTINDMEDKFWKEYAYFPEELKNSIQFKLDEYIYEEETKNLEETKDYLIKIVNKIQKNSDADKDKILGYSETYEEQLRRLKSYLYVNYVVIYMLNEEEKQSLKYISKFLEDSDLYSIFNRATYSDELTLKEYKELLSRLQQLRAVRNLSVKLKDEISSAYEMIRDKKRIVKPMNFSLIKEQPDLHEDKTEKFNMNDAERTCIMCVLIRAYMYCIDMDKEYYEEFNKIHSELLKHEEQENKKESQYKIYVDEAKRLEGEKIQKAKKQQKAKAVDEE